MTFAAQHWQEMLRLTLEHVLLCGVSLGIALAIAVPLGVWIHGRERRTAIVTGLAGVMYTVPSLALFAVLVPIAGLGVVPAAVGLVLYAQLMLVRAVVTSLDSVDADVREAAVGMGVDRLTILRTIDAPLAAPVFLAGLRVAAVTIIGIATIGAVIDAGGLGELILQGVQRNDTQRVLAGALAVTALAMLVDAAIVRAERRSRPWLAVRQAGAA